MDGGHQALLEPERFLKNLHHRGQAIRRARGVGDDVLPGRVVRVVVDTHDERSVGVAGRSGNNDLLRAGPQMGRGGSLSGEEAGRFDDDIDTKLLPREIRRVAFGRHREALAVDGDRRLRRLDGARVGPGDTVVHEQVRHGLDGAEVIDGDDVDVSALRLGSAEEVSADATETVDGDANSHEDSSIDGKRGVVRRRWRTVGGYETRSKSAAASRRGSWADWSAPTSS